MRAVKSGLQNTFALKPVCGHPIYPFENIVLILFAQDISQDQ
jgi:hypothetical protein